MPDFEECIHEAFLTHTHGDGNRARALADMLGMRREHLYRAVNPNDENANLKMRQLLPFMKLTNNYTPLAWLARRSGHALYKLPKRIARPDARTVNALSRNFNELIQALINLIDAHITRSVVTEQIDVCIEQLVLLKKKIEAGEGLPLEERQKCLPL